jgi:hypothetical protein
VNGWVEITGTNVQTAGLPTGTMPFSLPKSAVVSAWTCYGLDETDLRLINPFPTGHTDGAWNGTLECNLRTGGPWTQTVAPSATGDIPATNSSPFYTDGRPAAAHSYYTVQHIAKANRTFIFGQGAVWDNGGITSQMFALTDGASDYDNTAGDYSIWGTIPGSAFASIRLVVRHPVTEDVYVGNSESAGTGNFYRWSITGTTPASASFTARSSTGFTSNGYVGAVDTTRERILCWRGAGDLGAATTDAELYDITGNSWSTVTLGGTHASTITNDAGLYQGFTYCPTTDRYLVRRRSATGGTVYTIHPTTWAVEELTTTGGGSIVSDVNGPQGRFRYVASLASGSTVGGVFYHAIYDSNVWFLRLH